MSRIATFATVDRLFVKPTDAQSVFEIWKDGAPCPGAKLHFRIPGEDWYKPVG